MDNEQSDDYCSFLALEEEAMESGWKEASDGVGNARGGAAVGAELKGFDTFDQVEMNGVQSEDSDGNTSIAGSDDSSSVENLIAPNESDVVISMSDKKYKSILIPYIEKLERLKKKGEHPNVNKTAEEILNCFKELVQRNGRFLGLRKSPRVYEVINQDTARAKIKFDLARGVKGLGVHYRSSLGADDHDVSSSTEDFIEPNDNDVVISFTNKKYKSILGPYIERLIEMKDRGEKPSMKEMAEEIMRDHVRGTEVRFLGMKKDRRSYERMSDKDASRRIYMDLSRKTDIKKRPTEAAESTPTKKEKLTSAAEQVNGWGVRPKRGTQQLKDSNMHMPYHEKLKITQNPIGDDVDGYVENAKFKLRLVSTRDDKLACVGQRIAKEILSCPNWDVKYCEVGREKDIVFFRDCDNINALMASAKEGASCGSAKFTGYSKFAVYVLQNGLLDTLVKNSTEVKEFIKKIGLIWEQRGTGRDGTLASSHGHQTSEERHVEERTDDPSMQQQSTDRDQKSSVDAHVSSDYKIYGTGFEQLMHINEVVNDKLDNSKTKFCEDNDVWKRETSIGFYSVLQQWLVKLSRDESGIEAFKGGNVQIHIDNFEKLMAKLLAAEERNDNMNVEIAKNMIGYLQKKVQTFVG